MAARAMANFNLFDLHLVDPREGWDPVRAEAAASGAVETVKNASIHNTLPGCLKDMHYVYATTARPRDMVKDVMTPEQAGLDMRARIGRGEKVAILFGRERFGLNNEEVSLADMIITAPVNPDYASLNIAQAVLLVSYEWYKHEATSLGMGHAGARCHFWSPACRCRTPGLPPRTSSMASMAISKRSWMLPVSSRPTS